MNKPNLVYIHTHDTGRYIQPYGYAVETPRLMALARESALFRNNHCCAPTCSASRAAMLTGQHAHNNGMIGLAHRGFTLADPRRHLSHFLAQNGYETILCGIQHESQNTLRDLGYSRALCTEGRHWIDRETWDPGNAQLAAAFLDEKHDKPFFLSYGMYHTHREFCGPDPDINPDYVCVPPCLPDTPETRRDYAAYLSTARRADACVGTVLDALERNGLLGNTVVLFTTDHGIPFPWMKCNLTDAGTGVAMMLRYPNNPSAGRCLDGLTSHLDVFPTLCDLLDLPHPSWLQGVSLLPLLNRERDEVRGEIFTQVIYHASYEPQVAIRTRRHKYIRRYTPNHPFVTMPNMDPGPSRDYLHARGIAEKRLDDEQLYDLVFDPAERDNLAAKPTHAAVLNDLRARLDQWMRETNHPLLAGPVPLPQGAFYTRVTCPSPEPQTPEDRITS